MDFEKMMQASAEVERVDIGDDTFFMTSMSGANYDRIERMNAKTGDRMAEGVMQYTVAVCLCDEQGERYDPLGQQSGKLSKWPLPVIVALFKIAAKISGGEVEGETDPN